MPYLRITCPPLDEQQRRQLAEALTAAINDLFYNPRGRLTREELRERTTIHFFPYAEEDLFIGGKTPTQRGCPDITIELSDWSMSVRQQRKVAAGLTPRVAELFHVPDDRRDAVNIRFHSYPPTDFAVGGKLLSDIIPRIGRVMKRVFG
jgi:phenylpyruvate tautomerase PptA (4-oxalocrotonate tautomerase family)